jgi:predicted O-linked N-acetylglucosamine transferase (SPINDLY family)
MRVMTNDSAQGESTKDNTSSAVIAEVDALQQILAHAIACHQAQNLDQAEQLYQQVMSAVPNEPTANHNLGLIMLARQHTHASLSLLRTALEAAPEEPQYWLSYIDALLQAGQEQDARVVLQHAIEGGLQGKQVEAYIAKLLPPSKAKNNSQQTAKNAKPNADESNRLLALFKQGQFEAAELLAQQLIKSYPEHGFAWKIYGALLQQSGLSQEALPILQQAAQLLPRDAEVHYNLGNTLYDLGQLAAAATSYQHAIKIQPKFAEAHYNLGSVLNEQGQAELAVASYKKSLKFAPKHAAVHYNLALVLHELKQYAQAIPYYRSALALQADFSDARINLADCLAQTGKSDEAMSIYEKLIVVDTNKFAAYNNLALLYEKKGRKHEAEELYQHALEVKPDYIDALTNLGRLLRELGRFGDAETHYRKAISYQPEHAATYNSLAILLQQQGDLVQAEYLYKKAIQLDELQKDTHINLGVLYYHQKRFAEAEQVFLRVLELDPEYMPAISNMAALMQFQGKSSSADDWIKKGLSIQTDYLGLHVSNALNCLDKGLIKQAIESCFKILSINKDSLNACSTLLFSMNYDADYSAADYLQQAQVFSDMVAQQAEIKYSTWYCEPNPQKLRVGIVSGDLLQHPVGYFLQNCLKHLAGKNIELWAYANQNAEDALTEQVKPYFTQWRSIQGLSDKVVAETILADGIHILLDLSGHTAGTRLPVFGYKPAPVQASWLGYFASTGLVEMDYFLADEVSVPLTHQEHFVEKIIYLPDTRLCFTAPTTEIAVSSLPALNKGYITFASFQNRAKISDDVLALWAQVMQALPESRLRWQCKSFNDASLCAEIKQRMADAGIDITRVSLLANVTRDAYFAAHYDVDIILDSFPYTGGTTTCEALWMGVPTLTLAGESLIARQGASLLSAAGLNEWIADSPAQFVAKAVQFASDFNALSQLRNQLRAQVLASPLFDGERFAQNMQQALWQMWQAQCYGVEAFVKPNELKHKDTKPVDTSIKDRMKEVDRLFRSAQTFVAKLQFAEAVKCYQQALELAPYNVVLHNNYGNVLRELGRLDEALAEYHQIITLNPKDEGVYNNIALVHMQRQQYVEAERYCQQALSLNPKLVQAYNNLGGIYKYMGRLAEAQKAFLQAIALQPDYAEAYSNLGSVYKDQGHLYEADDSYQHALQLNPHNVAAFSNLLFSKNYLAQDGFAYRALAEEYGALVQQQASAFSSWQHDTQAQCLRVGLVSGDLRSHAVAFFLENMLQHLDLTQIELFAYVTDSQQDQVSLRLQPYFSAWKSLLGLNDAEAAQLIQQDGVHVLIDLAGHSAGGRLPVFAYKPAPVQVSWLGYFASTGVAEMDYFLADPVSVPVANQAHFVEKIYYLPDTRLCFTAPDIAMDVADLPALQRGFVTFGCFQNRAKVSDEVLALWAEVMQAVPNSRLRWQCHAFSDAAMKEDIRQRMAQFGVQPSRLSLCSAVSRQAYFAEHAEVDMILDSFPFTGGTTTCEALWLGVPTLTLLGDTLIARQGASLLQAAGLPDWIVESKAAFVQKAQAYCRDLPALAALRQNLRQQVLTSRLFDGERFAQHWQEALWDIAVQHHIIEAKASHQAAPSPLPSLASDSQSKQQGTVECIRIVSATRMSEAEFWSTSALGLSLRTHMLAEHKLQASIAFNNTRGLSEVFNEQIIAAEANDVLVFIHDDVWIDEANFSESVLAGLAQFDVVGVAGNKRMVANQPAWPFLDLQFTWDDKANLSGRVGHGKEPFGAVSDYGPVPAACELMDGLFLATTKRALTKAQGLVLFDPQFDFHFYDLDFCRTARQAGLRLGTWLVALTHQSGGAFGTENWRHKYQLYLKKWEGATAQAQSPVDAPALDQAIAEVLDIAGQKQQTGDWLEAVQLYQEIIKVEPAHIVANHGLGVLLALNQESAAALQHLETAVMGEPQNEQYWIDYLDVLMHSAESASVPSALELAQQYGLSSHTAQLIAAAYAQMPTHNVQSMPQAPITPPDTSVASVKSHIYQICYSEQTRLALEPGFLFLDNLSNPRPDWREYWPIRHYLLNNTLQDDAFYGFFSPKFKAKTGLDAAAVQAFVAEHAESDVILFSPFFEQSAFFLNIFEQAELNHQNSSLSYRRTAQLIAPHLNLKEWITHSANTVFSNYFVAKPKFWHKWLASCEQIFAIAEHGHDDFAANLNDVTNHEKATAPNKVFVIERMATLLLSTDASWRIAAYPSADMPRSNSNISQFSKLDELIQLDNIKYAAVKTGVFDSESYQKITTLINERFLQANAHDLTNAINDVIANALLAEQAGNIDAAISLYMEVLNIEAKHPEANYRLGLLEVKRLGAERALPRLEVAVLAKPESEQYWISYIKILVTLGATDTAMQALEFAKKYGLTKEALDDLSVIFTQSDEARIVEKITELTSNTHIDKILNQVYRKSEQEINHFIQLNQRHKISACIDLTLFDDTICQLVGLKAINEILTLIHKVINVLRPIHLLEGYKIFAPYFDHVLEAIEFGFDSIVARDKKIVNLVIATEVYDFGGHTKVITEILDAVENPILILTDVYNQVMHNQHFERVSSKLGKCPVFVLPKGSFENKSRRLAEFINSHAKNVFLLSHHDDVVAISACQKSLDTNFYFIHHADHNVALGNHVEHLKHVDLFTDIATQCTSDLKHEVTVLPIYAQDFGCKVISYPVKLFSTVSAGTSNKFDYAGSVNFAEVIIASIQTCGGKHYHFGTLSDNQLDLIRAHLAKASIGPESFVYMGNVSSLWNSLLEIDAHIYIGSFPKRGGKGEIEAQGAGYPLLIYKDPEDPKYLNVANCNPLTQNWHTQSDFCEGLRSIMCDHEKYASESRRFYLAHHTKSKYLAALNSLVQ